MDPMDPPWIRHCHAKTESNLLQGTKGTRDYKTKIYFIPTHPSMQITYLRFLMHVFQD